MTALLNCPFCGARPHQGLGPVRRCQLHGEKLQDFTVKCPHGCAQVANPTRERATLAWNRRAPSPAEVEALRAEVMRASTECADAMAQVVALRARVARMEELVHSAYAEGWQDSRIDEYDTAADRWEWAAARAALSAETP